MRRRRPSKEFIAALLKYQDHECGVCGTQIDSSAAVDHDHETGKTRGMLCRNCNVAEGHIRSTGMSPDDFGEALLAYLNRRPAMHVRAHYCSE